ncbi:DNA helicase [Tanacetum coccineum]
MLEEIPPVIGVMEINLLSLHKIVDSLRGYLCVTLGDKWKTIANLQGLTKDDGEAVKGCYKKFIDMVQVYNETTKMPWYEKKPKEDVVESSSGNARVKDPQGKEKDDAGIEEALEEDMNKKTQFGVRLEGNMKKEAPQTAMTLLSLSEEPLPKKRNVGNNEIDNRLRHFGNENSTLRRDIVEGLIELLDAHNTLVQLFRTVHEKYLAEEVPDFKVRLYSVIGTREYELPKGDMLGAIVYEAGPETKMGYDIIIAQRSGYLQRVNKLHPPYTSLQFPLLFIYGEDDYSKDMKLFGCSRFASAEGRRLMMKAYYANEYLSGIYDAIIRGDNNGYDIGGRLILPQSFTGEPRYMYSHYLNALTIYHVHVRYTVEFQKRGLPHCHTLIWIDESMRVRRDEDVDA